MPKPSASRGWVRALYTVPASTIIALACVLLVLAPARSRVAENYGARTDSTASRLLQPETGRRAASGRIQANSRALPLAFERNQGQSDSQVEYMARGDGYILFLTANDAVFSFHPSSAQSKTSGGRRTIERRTMNPPNPGNGKSDFGGVIRMQLAGANSLPKIAASERLVGTINYFLGNDPSKWQTNVAHYARVSYQEVYPGVNLAFHGVQRQLEFDFVVAPGASPAPIGFHFTGAQRLKTDDFGNLIVSSPAGDVLLRKPVAYQERNGARQLVDAQFALNANNVSFRLGNYDHNRELVIDPSVSYEYSTYLGGSGEDESYGVAFDSGGNAYVTGQTASPNFPVLRGVPPNRLASGFDVFVTKIAPDGSSLVYSTYVGGTGIDSGFGIAVDALGDAFVAGGTTSSDFPTTPGAYQTGLASGAIGNAFVFELNPSGNSLTYSTFVGGNGSDSALGVALDSSANVYVAGRTSSTNFPTTPNPPQTTVAGGFVTKLNSSGNGLNDLVYSTYLGGAAGDNALAIAVDSSGNAYITGQALSASFPHTSGVVQPACSSCGNGVSDAFVTVINTTGTGFVYSTFLGGSGIDVGDGIAVDSSGNAYVTGLTG